MSDLGVPVRPVIEKQPGNKHVESLLIICLDEGSIPSDSTNRANVLSESELHKQRDGIPLLQRLIGRNQVEVFDLFCTLCRIPNFKRTKKRLKGITG